MATNSPPIAGARKFASRLIVNVYQQWTYALDARERDVLCWLVADTIGYGAVGTRIHGYDLYTLILGASRMPEGEREAQHAALNVALESLIARGAVIAGPEDAEGGREVMVNLRWEPEEHLMMVGPRGASAE